MNRFRGDAMPKLLLLVWIPAVLLATYELAIYSNTPGDVLPQPAYWPADAHLQRSANTFTLLVTIHPRCACSRATLAELEKLLAQTQTPVKTMILLWKGHDGELPQPTGIERAASGIPGAVVEADPEGRKAARFQMSVSGETALYDAQGRLRFSGGITQARGHEGDNAGSASILSILRGQSPDAARTLVFGCSLLGRG